MTETRSTRRHLLRRHLFGGAVCLAAAGGGAFQGRAAGAQATPGFPNRPVRVVVPFPPGQDVTANRAAASAALGRRFAELGMETVRGSPEDAARFLRGLIEMQDGMRVAVFGRAR